MIVSLLSDRRRRRRKDRPDSLKPIQRALNLIQPPTLVLVPLLQRRDPFLEFTPRFALRSDHLICLLEQIDAQVLQLAVQLR